MLRPRASWSIVRVDVKHHVVLVEAVRWADDDTVGVLAIPTRLADDTRVFHTRRLLRKHTEIIGRGKGDPVKRVTFILATDFRAVTT
jgi:hypothetical protein